jgi:hypothetical protein
MMATHDPAIEAAVALLAQNGYKVSKTRARVARNAAQPDTLAAIPCAHCGTPASRVVRIGGGKGRRKAAYLREVGVCEACYRFGPNNKRTPLVSRDPARYARLYGMWRKAHHRFARRKATVEDYHLVRQADTLADHIKRAMQDIGNRPNEEGLAA